MGMMGASLEDKAAVAIGTFDGIPVAHFQIDFGVTQGAANALAGDAAGLNFDGFGRFDGHGGCFQGWKDGDHTG